MSLINLRQISINFGGHLLLDQANLQINAGEHLCLIGRNGVGKSTLLKLITQQLEADSGTIERQPGLQTAYLSQEIPRNFSGCVYDVVAHGLGKLGDLLWQYEQVNQQLQTDYSDKLLNQLGKLQHEIELKDAWKLQQKVEKILSQVGLKADLDVSTLSGGLTRRVLLAKALVSDPDILVLDEPTNHLDIDAITWLESFLSSYNKTLLFVSHDRAFMQALASRFIEIDTGKITSYPGNYQAYLTQKEAALHAQLTEQKHFDKKLAQEEVWIRQGIKARRTRNEGRVRALEKMRALRADRKTRPGKANIAVQEFKDSGKIVFEADQLSYQYDDSFIIKNFSTIIARGDKIGLIGPNGSGKTTLIKLLLKQLEPSLGEVKHGTKLSVAYFDQYRHQLDEEKTVQENVYHGDMITVDNKDIHVITYLQNFLFSPQRARTKVKVLSGGERNRLLLAKLFTKSSNVLVMDEPTNDLDIETLELLEEQLSNYKGTVLLVSHDRAFLNNIVTSTLVLEGNGKIGEYVGGYDDWLRQRCSSQPKVVAKKIKTQTKQQSNKLGYKEQRELEQLPEKIAALENKIQTLQQTLSGPQFYQQPESKQVSIRNELEVLSDELQKLYSRWELLESKS